MDNTFSAEKFHMPRYTEIPAVGLYLKQVVKFIDEITQPVFHSGVTETMLSNYVKLHVISNPVKKQYSREQIADMIFIVFAKNVLSLESITAFLAMAGEKYTKQESYDYFCCVMEEALVNLHSGKASGVETEGMEKEKSLLHSIVSGVANKCYLEDFFAAVKNEG